MYMFSLKVFESFYVLSRTRVVTCICNTATLKAEYYNGVDSISVKVLFMMISGEMEGPDCLQISLLILSEFKRIY